MQQLALESETQTEVCSFQNFILDLDHERVKREKGSSLYSFDWNGILNFRQIQLVVLTPDVRIPGDPDIHVKEGSRVAVDCVITNTTEPVPFVTWIFNNQVKGE